MNNPFVQPTTVDTTVFIDIETDRLNPIQANPIQIAAIAVDRDTLAPIEEFEIKIAFPVEFASPDALERNCYTPEAWIKAALPLTAMTEFNGFLDGHGSWERTAKSSGKTYATAELAGHNIALYDAVLLRSWYKRFDGFLPAAAWVTGPVDTMQMARSIEWARGERWEEGFSLGALCKRFGIVLEGEHDALNDVLATVELAKQLRGMIKEA
ncbi:MAG: 3'-5' exonuclease [Gammaproteobacteria bacterium]